jgi:hypothetical protein
MSYRSNLGKPPAEPGAVNSLLKDREMKQLRHVTTTFSLIIALTGLSSVVAAEAGRTSYDVARIQPDQRRFEGPLSYHLTLEQMDGINAGGRSGKPDSVNTSGRSGKPNLVNSNGRSGKPDLVNTSSARRFLGNQD